MASLCIVYDFHKKIENLKSSLSAMVSTESTAGFPHMVPVIYHQAQTGLLEIYLQYCSFLRELPTVPTFAL